MAYRRLLVEEFVYAPERLAAARQRAAEDAQFHHAAEALRKMK